MTKILYMVLSLAVTFAQGASAYELLGDSVFPEGIAYDDTSGSFFVGSATQGTILRVDAETGEVVTLVEGGKRDPFTTLGLKVDAQNGSGSQAAAAERSTPTTRQPVKKLSALPPQRLTLLSSTTSS